MVSTVDILYDGKIIYTHIKSLDVVKTDKMFQKLKEYTGLLFGKFH